MPAKKRARMEGGGDVDPKAGPRRKGMWASMKLSKAQPWDTYGARRVERGTPENLELFGATWKEADEAQREARKMYGYSGRGLYAPLAYAAGAGIDYAVKNPRATRDFFKRAFKGRGLYTGRSYSGRGEYTAQNELIAGSTSSPPMFQSVGDEAGALCISHREYVGDIFAPAAANVSDFTVQSFPLNPGLEQSFPWLSQIAQNYEEYELKQCVFEFVSTVQDINSSNGQVGTIITATQYNSSLPDFQDKPAMAAYAHSVSGKSTDNQTHGVECDPSKLSGSEGKYIRANPVMVGEDLKTYDHGRFQLATHNIPTAMASGTLGELYVNYTVVLRKPKFFTGRGLGLTRYVEVADATQGATFSASMPFGENGEELTARQNNIAIVVDKSADTLKFTFPAYYGGRLRIYCAVEGTQLAGYMLDATTTITGNVTVVKDLYAGGSVNADNPDWYQRSLDQYQGMFAVSINIEPSTNATDNSIAFGLALSGSPTINQSSIEITEYNTFGAVGAATLVNSAGTAVTL